MPLHLLPRHELIRTGPVDFADWNYRYFLGPIQKARFRLACRLLRTGSRSLLEIGYGSGVFMPELGRRTNRLLGIDVHDKHEEVMRCLRGKGIEPILYQSPAEHLPFQSHEFDQVVAISSLEFVTDLHQVCREVTRVLSPGGAFVVVTPGHSRLADLGLKLLTSRNAQEDFANRRSAIVQTLLDHFQVTRHISYPPLLHHALKLYDALRLTPI